MRSNLTFFVILLLMTITILVDAGPGGRSQKRRRRHSHGHDQTTTRRAVTNAPTTLVPRRCTKTVSATVTAMETYQVTKRVATGSKCGWLNMATCRKYRLVYQQAYRQVTRMVYVQVRKCCPGFMEVNGVCEPLGTRTMPPRPPPTTVITAPPAETTATTTDMVPHDADKMIDNKLELFVSFLIILCLCLIVGCLVGGIVVHCCGGRREVMRRLTTKRRKTRKGTSHDDKHGKGKDHDHHHQHGHHHGHGKHPSDNPPPQYDESCFPAKGSHGDQNRPTAPPLH